MNSYCFKVPPQREYGNVQNILNQKGEKMILKNSSVKSKARKKRIEDGEMVRTSLKNSWKTHETRLFDRLILGHS